MTPLTRRDVLAHQAIVPWPSQRQIEQDLQLCRAMAALFNVARSYFERHSELALEMKRTDGQVFSLKASDLNSKLIDQPLSGAGQLFERA